MTVYRREGEGGGGRGEGGYDRLTDLWPFVVTRVNGSVSMSAGFCEEKSVECIPCIRLY